MEKLLNKDSVRNNLILASLFVTSFEMLKSSIQDRIKGFLCLDSELNEDGEIVFEISNDYKTQVLKRVISGINRKNTRDYHLFYSSCLWLKEKNVIDYNDLLEIEKIRKHRNLISHNPLKLLIDENININKVLLKESQILLKKIEKWWILNFEIPINPKFNGKEIDERDIKSGRTIFLDYLVSSVNCKN